MRQTPDPTGGTATEVGSTVTTRAVFGMLRLACAALCLVALVARFIWGLGSATFTPGNFFAYLTIQSNILFLVVSIIAGALALRGTDDPPWLDTLRACVLSGTVSSGVVFAFLIQQAGARGFRLDVPWSDQVLHFWLPTIALLDWVIAPGRGRALWRTVAFVLVFTLGWGVVTLIRGEFVGWYPYFFLDPAQLRSVGEFFLFGAVALALFGGISSGLVGLSRLRPIAERELSWPRKARARAGRMRAGRRR
ncbi:Pr6Pr family membrane protein [Glaciihabitans sp. UYNi722]|uniref:Pr6Pr family membrane protein n=1 Tax=Glaciihabitans sp. UYNi722 TaxID=3156344 RepID=UPI0033927F82